MSQPPRHRDASTRASEELLRSARSDHAPNRADRDRVRDALSQRFAASADPLADASALRAASPARGLFHPLTKTAIGLAVAAAGFATLMRMNDAPESAAVSAPATVPAVERAAEAPLPPTAAGEAAPALERTAGSAKRTAARAKAVQRAVEAPAAKKTSATAGPRDDTPEPAASAVSAAEYSPRAASPSPSDGKPREAVTAPKREQRTAAPAPGADDGREELSFLGRIRAELLDAEHERVLELCDEHKRRWPHGVFAQEREALRAMATCEAETSNAAANARAFFASYPQSPMAAQVRAACAPQLKAAPVGKPR